MTMTMRMESQMKPSWPARVRQTYDKLGLFPFSIVQLMARFSLATIFWRSSQTKSANWDLTYQLFASEYKVPVLSPEVAATLAYSLEHYGAILLALGLLSRVVTLPLIGMTLVIEIFVYPLNWPDHLIWLTLLLLILTRGPGVVSLDYLAKRYFNRA